MSTQLIARRPRSAVVLIVALCAMALAVVVFATTVKMAAAQRRSLDSQVWQAQAAWLARSAVTRAAARLATEPAYGGESWDVPAAALGGGDAATVTVHVERVPGRPARRLVRAIAIFPVDPIQRARYVHEIYLDLEQGSQS
jgi:hypothetical protein